MNFSKPISVTDIADKYHLSISGEKSLYATGINEIHKVREGDITFVDIEKYYNKSLTSSATIIIINKVVDCPTGKVLLITDCLLYTSKIFIALL